MLLDRADTLATKINTYQKLKNSAAEAEQFGTRAKQFESASQLMAGLRETLSGGLDADARARPAGRIHPPRSGERG